MTESVEQGRKRELVNGRVGEKEKKRENEKDNPASFQFEDFMNDQ